MNRTDVDTFEKLKAQLDSLYQELGVLVKKAPNDALNPFKIRLVNAILVQCNKLFGSDYRPLLDFEHFSIDDLPSNSDVIFIVSQYNECAEKFRSSNIEDRGGWWFWRIDDEGEAIRTSKPKKLIS